jgi:SAM-dependent methyltransferase
MAIPNSYPFTRFLAAKKSIDDQALNRGVWQRLAQALSRAASNEPLQVLEVGAGIGTMVERLVEWGVLQRATYTAIDADPETIAEARRRLPVWMAEHGFSVREDMLARQHFWRGECELVIETEAIDLQRFVGRIQGQRAWDLLIAHAVLDLLDIPTTLPGLLSLLRRGGLFYFSLVFDGATILEPAIDPALDAQIEALYHQTMDQRRIAGQRSGDSRTGRHLFGQLRAVGAEILAAGSSDWVIFAGPSGYLGDDAYSLHFIIHTIDTALRGHPQLDPDRLAAWIELRHAQIEAGSLIYMAHQLDFFGRVSTPVLNP